MTLLSQFSAINSDRDASLPSPLKAMQDAARDQLSTIPMPGRKTEDWKYSFKRLAGSDELNKAVATQGSVEQQIDVADAINIHLVNGRVDSIESDSSINGLHIKRYSDLNEEESALIAQHSSEHTAGEFELLNGSLFEDALFISVDKGVVIERPVVLHQHHNGEGISVPRVFILANDSASMTVMESFDILSNSQGDTQAQDALCVPQTDCIISRNARLTYLRMNLSTVQGKLIGTTRAILKRDANFETHDLCLGSVLGRHDLKVVMAEPGAHCDLNGVVVTKNNEHFDNHTTIEHVAAHCTSEENYRCIADDSSHIVFNGRIHIHRDAQKTEGAMNNKNLLLSSKAAIDTKPELEIYADDVKCAHGATIGQLDPKEIYYLKTRGLSDQQARQMLTLGFVLELVRAVPVAGVAELWESRLSGMLSFQDQGE